MRSWVRRRIDTIHSRGEAARRWGIGSLCPIGVVVFAILSTLPARAQDPTSEPAHFHAFYSGDVLVSGTADELLVTARTFGAATFLPDSSGAFTHVVDLTTTPNTIRNGQLMFFGSTNGALFGEYQGQSTPPDADGNVTVSGTYTLYDGLGPFIGATGEGTFQGVFSLTTRAITIEFEGTLAPLSEASAV